MTMPLLREATAPPYLGRSRWPVMALSRAYEVRLGKMLQPQLASEADRLTPFLKAVHVQWGGVASDALPLMYSSPEESAQYAVRQGDLLVCEGGDVGRAAILGSEIPAGTIIQNSLHRVRPRSGFSSRYLLYVLAAIHSSGWFDVLCNRATIAHLTGAKLAALQIPAPPLPEQRAIAAFLDRETARIDELVAKKEQMVHLLGEQRSRVVDRAVTEGLNQEGRKWRQVGSRWRVPRNWSVRRLKLVVKEIMDTQHKTAPFYPDGEYLVVRTSNVRNGRLVLDDAKYTDVGGYLEWTNRGRPNAGDILFTREAPAGEACLVPKDIPLCLGQRMVLFRVDSHMMDSRYLLWAIYGGLADEFIRLLSHGSTVPHFNMSDIANIPITIPPLNEQGRIAEYLAQRTARVDAIAEQEQAVVRVLQERRQALITAAVTGQIDIPPMQMADGASAVVVVQ